MGGKDQRNYLYDCIQRKDVSSLAKFMMIMNVGVLSSIHRQKDDFDVTFAFVSAVIKSLNKRLNYPMGVGGENPNPDLIDACFEEKIVYYCQFPGCGKEFKSLRNLREHVKTHECGSEPRD